MGTLRTLRKMNRICEEWVPHCQLGPKLQTRRRPHACSDSPGCRQVRSAGCAAEKIAYLLSVGTCACRETVDSHGVHVAGRPEDLELFAQLFAVAVPIDHEEALGSDTVDAVENVLADTARGPVQLLNSEVEVTKTRP